MQPSPAIKKYVEPRQYLGNIYSKFAAIDAARTGQQHRRKQDIGEEAPIDVHTIIQEPRSQRRRRTESETTRTTLYLPRGKAPDVFLCFFQAPSTKISKNADRFNVFLLTWYVDNLVTHPLHSSTFCLRSRSQINKKLRP